MTTNTCRSPDEEFLHRLDSLRDDASEAVRCAYMVAAFHYCASQDRAIFEAINRDAGFWSINLAASQSAAINAIGRIYDRTKGALSAARLLDHARTYPGIFGHAALEARKASTLSIESAKEFARVAFQPAVKDFEPLKAALNEFSDLYEKTIEPLRNNVFAHSGNITRGQMHKMFGDVLTKDFHRLSLFALSLHHDLRELYVNGFQPRREEPPEDIQQLVTSPLAQGMIGQWEHQYTVRETVSFLNHIKATIGANESRRAH